MCGATQYLLMLETFRVCAKLLLLGTHTWDGALTEAFIAAGVILAGYYGAKHRDSAALFVCEIPRSARISRAFGAESFA